MRPKGKCPRQTPGCTYADCSDAKGKSCSSPNAPMHRDMFQNDEDMAAGLRELGRPETRRGFFGGRWH